MARQSAFEINLPLVENIWEDNLRSLMMHISLAFKGQLISEWIFGRFEDTKNSFWD